MVSFTNNIEEMIRVGTQQNEVFRGSIKCKERMTLKRLSLFLTKVTSHQPTINWTQ